MDERAEKLETLRTIYPELVINSQTSARLELPIVLQNPLQVVDRDDATPKSEHERLCLVSHLPPLLLSFDLSEDYPTNALPAVKIAAMLAWLPDDVRSNLEAVALSLWEEYDHEQVLFTYISHVQDASETGFGLERIFVSKEDMLQLLEYDRNANRVDFGKGSYECGICLTPSLAENDPPLLQWNK